MQSNFGNNPLKETTIEQKLKQLAKAKHQSSTYSCSTVPCTSFHEWYNYTSSLKDPDALRTALYYGFQPLYDALITNQEQFFDGFSRLNRAAAHHLLEGITSLTSSYLESYYMGKPKPQLVSQELPSFSHDIEALADVLYKTKSRNIDTNTIFPDTIHRFLVMYLTALLDKKVNAPEYIVGSACGSSEIALSLGRMLGVPIGFMRMSKRRQDSAVKIIKEHEPFFRMFVAGKQVTCIEDYVCTKKSLKEVMSKTKHYSPASVTGASVRDSCDSENYAVKTIIARKNFHVFVLR